MAWKKLTIDDLRLVLSEDEVEKLNTLSLEENITDIINSQIELISQTWRGSFQAKGYEIDPRDYYIPSAYAYWVLVHARSGVWARFPMSSTIAFDENRKEEAKRALELLKNPALQVDAVEWYLPDGHTPNPDLSAYTRTAGASLSTPWLRFPTEEPVIENFDLPIWRFPDK